MNVFTKEFITQLENKLINKWYNDKNPKWTNRNIPEFYSKNS